MHLTIPASYYYYYFAAVFVSCGYGLQFVQDSATVSIPGNFPIGSTIFHVITIDEGTGDRPENVLYRLVRTTTIPPLNDKSTKTMFAVDNHTGAILLSPHRKARLKDYKGYTFALQISGSTIDSGKPVSSSSMFVIVKVENTTPDNEVATKYGSTKSCNPREELCFVNPESIYKLPESIKVGVSIGSVKPRTYDHICPELKYSYQIEPLGILSIDEFSGELSTQEVLDFEQDQKYNFNVSCRLTEDIQESSLIAIFNRELTLFVKDVNDNPPYLQASTATFAELDSSQIIPDRQIPVQFTVLDKDTPEVNNIKTELDDPYHLFRMENPTLFANATGTSMLVNTVVLPRKPFRFIGPFYNFSVRFKDDTLVTDNQPEDIVFNVKIVNSSFSPDPEVDESITDTEISINVSRYASQHAKVAQLMKLKSHKSYRFFRLSYQSSDLENRIFGVTRRTGIIFVQDQKLLLNSSLADHTFNLTWGTEQSVEGTIRVVIRVQEDLAKKECASKDSSDRYPTCAIHDNQKTCSKSCGQGSPDGFCKWRPHRQASEDPPSLTSFYATCSSDLTTCPDGQCDELETMDKAICPQDCASSVHGEAIMSHTEQGIGSAAAPCTCDASGTCTCIRAYPLVDGQARARVRENNKSGRKSEESLSRIPHAIRDDSCGASCITLITVVAASVLSLSIFAVLAIFRQVKKSRLEKKHRYVANRVPLSSVVSDYVDVQNGGTDSPTDSLSSQKSTVDTKWEFRRDRLILQETLGEGEFGKVLKAQAWNIADRPGYSTVAVKTLKENSTSSEEQDLLSEFNLLKEVSHPNVIRLLGACTTKGGPLYIIVEYAELGSLRSYLRKIRHGISSSTNNNSMNNPLYFESTATHSSTESTESTLHKEMYSFGWQIAKGMTYLGDMKLVHRDLAARNILLAENKVVKISDFGLSRDVYEGDTYLKTTKGRVPFKWLAIESLEDQIYTIKSDVWSYGIVLWEIITLGSTPYPGMTPEKVFRLLKQGYRMPQPESCPPKLYKLMRACWRDKPHERPSFKELVRKLEGLMQDSVEYLPLSPGEVVPKTSYMCPIGASPPREFSETKEAQLVTVKVKKVSKSRPRPVRLEEEDTLYEKRQLLPMSPGESSGGNTSV